MIARIDLTQDQAQVIRAEAVRLECTVNELARLVVSKWIYQLEIRHMDPSRQPKQHVGEDWL